jgi:A118 family predicted phage portal protein
MTITQMLFVPGLCQRVGYWGKDEKRKELIVMPFPNPGTSFPPEDYRVWYNHILEWAAWFSGDPQELLNLYSSTIYWPNNDIGRFWARMEADERSSCVHLPAAGDIASTSANLLFSESPVFSYDQKASGGDRITAFMKENGFLNLILEAAELSAALSGVFLKLDVEPGLLKLPVLSVITPSQAIPYFWRGRLWEVLFFRTVKEEQGGSVVWRLFELRRRENMGKRLIIEYRLYRGSIDRIGRIMELDSIDETANLGLVDTSYNIDGLGCVYVPNMRPNRLIPGSPLGINDYAGVITMMDSLDFAWTSWIRDIELGMAQILVDEELLEKNDGSILTQETAGAKARFNKFQKAFVKLNLAPWRMGGENVKPIEQVQFDIRVEDHAKTCETLLFQIVTQCGYSPHTFGIVQHGQVENSSGTALHIRERKSLLTREKKSRYWQPEIRNLLWQMQQLDVQSGLSTKHYEPQEIDVELQDSIITDPKEQSETIRNLEQAKAISTYTKIKMLHPEWEDKDVKDEVQRILDDQGLSTMPFEEEEM